MVEVGSWFVGLKGVKRNLKSFVRDAASGVDTSSVLKTGVVEGGQK
jgi:hypothetical protein